MGKRKRKLKEERRCRNVLEEFYGRSFDSHHPSWLINPNSNMCLEIDCYNEELGLGVEYNGPHHNKPNKIEKDMIKRKICEDIGFILITVDYKIKYKDIRSYLLERLPDESELLSRNFKPPN